MVWPDYKGKSIGFAKVMAEVPLSDGAVAEEILNFSLTERGFLDSTFRIMKLIPDEWSVAGTDQPVAFGGGTEDERVYAMSFFYTYGGIPNIIFLSSSGVFTFEPSDRANTSSSGNVGLVEQIYYRSGNSTVSVTPQSEPQFPPQIQQVNNRTYFTFCDGGNAWVWDGSRLRSFGFTDTPSPIDVEGPSREWVSETTDLYSMSPTVNNGGFSPKGRIGSVNSEITDEAGTTVGGINFGKWRYAVAFENSDGAFSATSPVGGGTVEIRAMKADPDSHLPLERLRKRFWLKDIPEGPDGTVARILLRTRDLYHLPSGDFGDCYFLHKIYNNTCSEWIDDVPDGELSLRWDDREPVPFGFYFMRYHSGSMFIMRTEAYPSRVWWSEQTGSYGPIPESILRGHWREVFPETGPITGSISTHIQNLSTTLLIFKESSVHYCTGQYPNWEFGTLHNGSGCAGPNLSQAIPDGSVIWYGSRTFWQLTANGQVTDIGGPLRKRLSRINYVQAHMGSSWVDKKFGEVSFVLPSDDEAEPDLHFVYDYNLSGWRLRDHMIVNDATVMGNSDVVLLAGIFDGERTVWVANRGYPEYETKTGAVLKYTEPTPSYVSSWVSYEDMGPWLHSSYRSAELMFTLEERHGSYQKVSTKSDWNPDTTVNSEKVELSDPEDDNIPIYAPWGPGQPAAGTAAEFDVSEYRERRTFAQRLAVDVPSASVFRVELSSEPYVSGPISIMNIDMYGAPMSLPGGRARGPSDKD